MTIPLTPPSFVRRSTVELAYPYAAPTTTIELPSPEYGNQENLSWMRLQAETRGGDLLIYRDSAWPKDDELVCVFTNLKELQKQNLEEFIQRSLGKEFKYTDHQSLIWKAIITNPNVEMVQDARDRYTVNLTMNVELISWP